MKVFITGITGSLGTAVTKYLLEHYPDCQIYGYSRDELRQQKFMRDKRITLTLGCIRDRDRLLEATRGMDIIFHLAAVKHVDLLELNPEEAASVNIDGTRNVLYAQRMNRIPRVVLSSTDKAVYPVNAYGDSKAMAEKLILRNPKNLVFRWGNVIASNGSVVPQFVKSIKDHQTAYVTDTNMIRFWITLNEAAKFIVTNSLDQNSSGLIIPEMRAAKVVDVALAVAAILGVSTTIKTTGPRPGEKLSECLRTQYEGAEIHAHTVPQFSMDELIQTLTPVVQAIA